jgi:phosphatidate cytidylyltransferase
VSEVSLRICSSLVLAVAAVTVTWLGSFPFYVFWVIAAGLIFLEWTRISAYRPGWLVAGAVYAAAFLAAMILLRDGPFGREAILWLFALVWATDSAAYFGGRAIGGPKLWPKVSPGKTWSGAIIGTISGVAAGLLLLAVLGIALHPMQAVFGFLIVVAAQFGDLLESAIKRRFHVKDASRLIPGHGGVMDRCDSLAAAAVIALVLGGIRFLYTPAQGLLAW